MTSAHDRPAPLLRGPGRVIFSGWFVLMSVVIAVISGVAALLILIQTPYQIVLPGPVTDVQHVIQPYPKPIKGALLLTTISSSRANAAQWLYAKVRSDAGLVPREEARPRNVSEREYQHLLTALMSESKVAAKVVALRAAGYDVKITGQGAQVREVAEGSSAQGLLQPDDIIIAVDGEEVRTANDLVAYVRAKRPGDTVSMRLRRGDHELTASFALGESPDEPGRARVGVIILTHLYEYELPAEFDVQTRDIGGSSAGLMFALGIYNAVVEGDITGGRTIAGTGSVTTEGNVNAVGGVKYKAIAAQRAGAEMFLVPVDNLQEAQENAGRMQVVPVRTFSEALDFLRSVPAR